MNEAKYPIVVIKDENDVEEFLKVLHTNGTAAFRIDMSVGRLASHDLVDLVNKRYKDNVANNNTELARVA